MGRRLALLVATYEYQDAGLRRLTAPAHDAEALAEVLQDPAIAGFEVTTLINEPYSRVGRAISDLYRDRRRDDLTLLYFTGHGLKDDAGKLYLAMTDTRRDGLMFSGLSAEHIDQTMDAAVSHQQVLVLDCCYSGSYPAGRGVKGDDAVHTLSRLSGRGRVVLTSSDATQYAFEDDQVSGSASQSVFTRFFVDGIRDGSADADGDGEIALDELYAFVHDNVVRVMPQQRPKKKEDISGRIFVARNVHWALPEYVRAGLNSPIVDYRHVALRDLMRLHSTGNDVVRGIVLDEIRGLAKDDSKSVCAVADQFLSDLTPRSETPPEPAPPNQGWAGGFTRYSVGHPGRTALARAVPGPADWSRRDAVLDGAEIQDAQGVARLDLRAASLRGHAHRHEGGVRQDDYAFRRTDDGRYLVVTVSDGVSTGRFSHLAATLVARRGCELMASGLASGSAEDLDWTALTYQLGEEIRALAGSYLHAPAGGRPFDRRAVASHMAATAYFGVIDLVPSADGYSLYHCGFGDSAAWLLRQNGNWESLSVLRNVDEIPTRPIPVLPLEPESGIWPTRDTLRPGEVLVLMTDGLGGPLLAASGPVGTFLSEVWREPPEPLAFAAQLDFAKRGYMDDRTAVAIWPSAERPEDQRR
ncbi:hypothetical protein L3i22_058770 [Actinoplanes sp. L3-i22]|nr:caspase family protein [Actinoplanes sp. L3-i22]BCY10789.1 hypothetical protein L3i22_058770 [Actinoplanes sp. L3-i22]